jgi:hypothetical protein
MKKEVKERIFRVLFVALFLTVSIVVVLPYLVQISVYFHERAHLDALTNYHVDASCKASYVSTIYNFYFGDTGELGSVSFDQDQYNKLGKYQKTEIHLAGMVSDVQFLIFIVIFICLTNLFAFYRIKNNKKINLGWILAINWFLFIWFLALVKMIILNLTDFSGDFFQLIQNLR